MTYTNEKAALDLEEVRRAMSAPQGVRIDLVPIFFNPQHKEAVQVYDRDHRNRWKKVGPLIFPYPDQTIADILVMLYGMRREDS